MAGPAHRSVSNIRPSIAGSQAPVTGAPASPHTPIRTISSSFASPSTLRAEEDYVIIELGSRYLRAGFAGDALPKAVIGFGPEQQRRAGDYRKWQAGFDKDWRKRGQGKEWGEKHELWKLDLRSVDLGLVGDKIDRAIREAFTNYLLIDSRPRRMALVLPPALPLPLLSTILDTLFNNFQPPTISLMSAPVLTTIAGGLRAALVVDIGWAETVVTGIYEYREVHCCRTIRASKLLGQEMMNVLGKAVVSIPKYQQGGFQEGDQADYRKAISFEECEEVVARVAWCKPSKNKPTNLKASEALPPVEEEDEIEASMQNLNVSGREGDMVSVPLTSTQPPMTLQLPFSALAEPCEIAFFADGIKAVDLDDEELPLHLLVYRSLLHLPIDVRSVCMSRIILTGGASSLPGLKNRIIDEVQHIIRERDWDPVHGMAVDKLRTNLKLRSNRSKIANDGPIGAPKPTQVLPDSIKMAASDGQESDPIEDKIQREARKGSRPSVKGTLRVIESMGSWSGGSLLCQLKIPAVSIVEKEQWLQVGAAGASRCGEAAIISQRQSMGPGGLRGGPGDRSSWTLGPWG